MIRLLPLEKRTNYDAILELYFYMVAMATPFCPEDIFPTSSFHMYGDIQKPAFSITSFNTGVPKRPRDRTAAYKALLAEHNISDTTNLLPEEHLKNDARLAKKIIEKAFEGVPADRSLYNFLYEDIHDDFHVRKDRLHCLLTSYMDTESLEQANLCFECSDPKELPEVFRYTRFTDLSGASPQMKLAVQLMGLLEVPVCPYCNRNFTTTISSDNGTRQGQFDHYRSKSKYPWFALSLMNLIPACGYCNQSKGDTNTLVLYPYKEGMDRHYRFRTRPVHGIGYLVGAPLTLDEFKVIGEDGPIPALPDHVERIHNSLKLFHLSDLYQAHPEHIAWIFHQRYIFPDTYLESLCRETLKLFSSPQEVRDMLYLRHLSPDRWGEHPLSKLTHDIDEEISELESYSSTGTE